MKIGMFSRSIYPRRGASAVVTEELARCFAREELCIVGGRKLFNKAIDRSASDVEVLALPSEINVNGRGDRFFEAFRWLLFPWHLWRATRFCRAQRCECIVATFPDELFLLLGLKVAQRLGVPLYAYLHNTVVENRTGWRLRLAAYVQRRVFREAAKILVISEGMERFYRAEYPDVAFATLPHVFADYPVRSARPAIREGSPKTVVLCGNFNRTNMDATRRVVEALGGSDAFRVILYTPVPRMLLKMRGIDLDKVARVEYVADAEFMARLGEADLLVLTHGLQGGISDIEYRTIFPTRTVPLLLAGRPLLVHAPANSFLAEFIREHGCGVVVDEPDERKIRAAALLLTSDRALAESGIARAAQAARMFHGPVVRARLRAALEPSARSGSQ
jgi:hypothetical protein